MINGYLQWSSAIPDASKFGGTNQQLANDFILYTKNLITDNISKANSLPMEYEYYLSYNFRYVKQTILVMSPMDSAINRMAQLIAGLAIN